MSAAIEFLVDEHTAKPLFAAAGVALIALFLLLAHLDESRRDK